MTPEVSLERALKRWCQSRGYMFLKLGGPGGWPDRTVFLPGGKIVVIELKSPTGKLGTLQQQWLHELDRLGFRAIWGNNFETITKYLESIGQS